jgi:peroxiredoxin (alkyl hydroperoxide reductase subunit C)
MPLNWKPGEKVIIPAPKTVHELEERLASNLEMVDFYLAKKSLN